MHVHISQYDCGTMMAYYMYRNSFQNENYKQIVSENAIMDIDSVIGLALHINFSDMYM